VSDTYDIVSFQTQSVWRNWLETNHEITSGIWLRLFKKDSGVQTVSYQQALDEALCFGWIDGQKKKYDNFSWIQKFTPRRPKSLWSKRNQEHIERLTRDGLMQKNGLKEVELAKKDGRWEAAYEPFGTMEVPEDFVMIIKKDKQIYEFFKTLNKANLYAIAFKLQTAKKVETRERRMIKIIDRLREGKKFH